MGIELESGGLGTRELVCDKPTMPKNVIICFYSTAIDIIALLKNYYN